nr:PREDICTED: T-cell antigen CD7 isoform X2 [Rhinolophus sinicus]
MLTSAPSLLIPMMLWALLLLPSSLSVHKGGWDNPTCTSGVVSVSRGERAEMACNMSNPFKLISICLVVPGKECRLIFKDMAQGHFSQDGWRLRVQGRTAQLVMEEAQDTQAGKYKWEMVGRQRSIKCTTLNISGPEVTVPQPEAISQRQRRTPLGPVLLLVILSILGLGLVLCWFRRRRSARTQQLLQHLLGSGARLAAADRKSADPRQGLCLSPALGEVAVSMAPGLCLLPMLLGLAGALPGALATQDVCQFPYVISPKGGSINITCSFDPSHGGVYLKQNWGSNQANVIYYEDEMEPTVDNRFWGRITFLESPQNLTITIQHLQLADTGIYVCQGIKHMNVCDSSMLVVVTDTLSQAANTCQEAQLIHVAFPVALAVGFLLIGLGLGAMCVLRKTQIKKLCCVKDKSSVSVVYEDMSCSRHNTMSTPNHYQ